MIETILDSLRRVGEELARLARERIEAAGEVARLLRVRDAKQTEVTDRRGRRQPAVVRVEAAWGRADTAHDAVTNAQPDAMAKATVGATRADMVVTREERGGYGSGVATLDTSIERLESDLLGAISAHAAAEAKLAAVDAAITDATNREAELRRELRAERRRQWFAAAGVVGLSAGTILVAAGVVKFIGWLF